MKCWICSKPASGLRHSDTRFAPGDARRYPADWVFCSRRCQDIFHRMYSGFKDVALGHKSPKEVPMTTHEALDRQAKRQCLKAFGQAAEAVGFELPLGQYSEAQALQVIGAIVDRYCEAMAAEHAATKYPPVRGMAMTADPLAGLESDLPWEGQ